MDLEGVYIEDQKKDTLLAAGLVQVRITDWFFFKDKADLKYIGLKDATIHFNRTDSVWNYRFLSDYFASTDSSAPKKSAGVRFNFKKVLLENVSFVQRDRWRGKDMTIRVAGLDADINDLSISDRIVDITNVELQKPYFSTFSYTPIRKDSSASLVWNIRINDVDINDGRFRMDNGTQTPTVSYFDSKHLDLSSINGKLKNFRWINDVLSGNVDLSARERSGLVLRTLKSNITIDQKGMKFEDLVLKTNNSTLGDYFSLRYPSMKSLANFTREVIMEANFDNATIASDDIALFAPGVRSWNRNIKIDGHVEGTVDALAGHDLEVWMGNNTYINGNISLVGLPDINKTLINIEAKELRTNYADAVSFIPSIRNIQTPNLRKLSYLRFTGTYTGFVNDFVTYGTLQTNLGTLRTDLNMKFPKNGEPIYSGSLSTDGFELGAFVNSTKLGIIDFHGTIKGRGFNWKTLNMTIDGMVHKIRYDKYTYQNITAKGTFSKRQFNGDFVINDPNAELRLSGIVDLSGPTPLFNATADVVRANLKPLQLTQQDFRLSGKFRLNLQGSNLSNLLGTARISDATLLHGDTKLSFDSLYVFSNYINGVKTLKAVSNEFDATITGNFDLAALPDAFTLFLSRYYPSYIKAPAQVRPQAFTFDITTGVVEDYIRLIDPRLSGFNNSRLIGSLNVAANTMEIDADVPGFRFKNYEFSEVKLKGTGDFQKLALTGEVGHAVIDSSIVFPETYFTINAQNDVSDITVKTTSNQVVNQADLSAQIKTFSDGASIVVNPSTFVINGKTWNIERGGELNFRKNTVVQGEVLLKESQQEILVQTVPSSIGNWNDLQITLREINLGDLSPFIFKQNHLEGTLSGDVLIEDPARKFFVTANIRTDRLQLDNDSLGRITATINYDNQTGILTGKGGNEDPQHHIDFDMSWSVRKNAGFQNRISLRPVNFQLKYLERFIGIVFSDLQGYMSGSVDIVSDGSHMDYLAKVRLKDATFVVNFSKVAYRIEDTEIELRKDVIDLNGIRIRDRRGNIAQIKGDIRHKGFKEMVFDLAVDIVSPHMEVMNTTYKDNQDFYGRAWADGKFVLVGPQDDLYMRVEATQSTIDSSYITLPPAKTRQSGLADFMVEKKYGREMTTTELRGTAVNIEYDIIMTANPMANVEVILDELTGDIIRGRGNGTLTLHSGTYAPLTMQGRFDIEEGSYLFTFQSVFKKPFVLRKGQNNFINWSGDPYEADINLVAVYTAERVSFAPLAATLLADQAQANRLSQTRDNVNVVATLTGKLFEPAYHFKLEFPGTSPIYSDPGIAFALQQIERNQNELNKQVTYLIVFNSFAPYESSDTYRNTAFEELTFNTISGLVSNELNKQLDRLFGSIFRSNKNRFTFNYSGSLYNRNLIDPNAKGLSLYNYQFASNISLGSSLFEGRAIFTVGGTFDLPLENTFQQNFQLLPDVTLEILLNQSGTVRATFFYRQNIDFIYGNTTAGSPILKRFGTSLSYNKEADTIGEFLFGKKKRKKGDTTAPVPVDTTGGNQ